jgi:hypothetical protein
MPEKTCGFIPYPGNGAYGHWTCGLPPHHRSDHRFNNYTIPRIPRFWRVKMLARLWRSNRRLRRQRRKYGMPAAAFGYRRALYPAAYRPIETKPHFQLGGIVSSGDDSV